MDGTSAYDYVDFTKKSSFLNGHFILHGRVPDYATNLNSLRAILLIDSIAHLREKQKLPDSIIVHRDIRLRHLSGVPDTRTTSLAKRLAHAHH
jgi:hypothetical protein